MTSALNTKINSYTLERGLEFAETYSLTPTRTGTNPLGTFVSGTAVITYDTNGPLGGNGSWKFPIGTAASTNGTFAVSTALTNELQGVFDGDYSIGFWIRFNALPTGTSNSGHTFLTIGSGSSYGFILAITGSTHATAPSRLFIDTANNFTYGNTQFVAGNWYYIAIRRTGVTNPNHYIYINGVLEKSFYDPGTGTTSLLRFGSTAGVISSYFNISNYYLAPSSVIGPTQIAEIWTVGNTAPVTNNLKYWDGTNWTIPTNKYQWNGTNWVTLTGQYWNGSAWTNIT